jgi:hypothetical protein
VNGFTLVACLGLGSDRLYEIFPAQKEYQGPETIFSHYEFPYPVAGMPFALKTRLPLWI